MADGDDVIAINIFGGCQQILPNATRAVQNFYGDQFAGERSREEALERLDLSPEARRLSIYIDDTEALAGYVSRLASCVNASELAVVVMDMVERQPRVTREEIVRERFIRTLADVNLNDLNIVFYCRPHGFKRIFGSVKRTRVRGYRKSVHKAQGPFIIAFIDGVNGDAHNKAHGYEEGHHLIAEMLCPGGGHIPL